MTRVPLLCAIFSFLFISSVVTVNSNLSISAQTFINKLNNFVSHVDTNFNDITKRLDNIEKVNGDLSASLDQQKSPSSSNQHKSPSRGSSRYTYTYLKLFKYVRSAPELLSGLQILIERKGLFLPWCSTKCARNRKCHAFALKGDICLMLTNDPFGARPYIYSEGDYLFVYKRSTFSVLAYRVSSGVGGDAIVAYNDNSYVSALDETSAAVDLSVPLTKTYKSALLDRWNTFKVVEVELSFRRPDGSLGRVIFNAEKSTSKYHWMDKNNLLSSPWSDLSPSTTVHNFGVFGGGKRRFYMMTHGGCPGDRLYLAVIDPAGDGCSWARGYRSPEILYSPKKEAMVMKMGPPGKATDLFVVMKVKVE